MGLKNSSIVFVRCLVLKLKEVREERGARS